MKQLRKTVIIMVCCIMALAAFPTYYFVGAEDNAEHKVVRVGWYESPFNLIDQYGRRSGYAYTIHNLVKLTSSVSPTASHLPQRGRQYPAPSLRELSAKLTEGVLKLWIVVMHMIIR